MAQQLLNAVQETCPDSWGVVSSALVPGYAVSGFMGWRRQSQQRGIRFNGGSRKLLTKEQSGPSAEGQFHPREDKVKMSMLFRCPVGLSLPAEVQVLNRKSLPPSLFRAAYSECLGSLT